VLALTLVAMVACSASERALLDRSIELLRQGFDAQASAALASAAGEDGRCDAVRIAGRALMGWDHARAAAPRGGAPDAVAPARETIDALRSFTRGEAALEAEYAIAIIQAAVAAAQDERPEMALLLTHARDLSERLAQRGHAAVWPRSFNLAAGELWHEVDRFEEARKAFERAARADGGAAAAAGLARAHARLGDRAAACAAYRRVTGAAPRLADEAKAFLATCVP
jgi:tetratricopeptide (TPR) repeat protein